MAVRAKTMQIGIGGLLIGLIAGGAVSGYLAIYFTAPFFLDGAMLGDSVNAQARVAVLQHLRRGERDRAIELLETELDGDIISLRVGKEYSQSTNDAVRAAVSRAQEYRAAFPRTTKFPEVDNAVNEVLGSVPSTSLSTPSPDARKALGSGAAR